MSDKNNLKKHEFPQANSKDKLWRYMSFRKFIWLLENKQLYQTSISRFNDPFEGSLPINTKKAFEEQYAKWYPTSDLTRIEQKRKLLRDTTFASCWSLRETESEAFWKIYCRENDGIAVKTTYGKLEEYASTTIEIIGKVKYINYKTDNFDIWSPAAPFMHKRKSFDFESEVRIITVYDVFDEKDIKDFPNKMVINIPIEKLIDEIVVYPYSSEHYIEFIQSVVSRYSSILSQKVKKSELIEEPIF